LLPCIFFFFNYKLQQIEDVIEEKIFSDPTRIFNGSKSTGKVLACKGDKKSLARTSIRVMFAFSAAGMTCPPILIYLYKRTPSEIAKRVPDD
jgi:hypothetical protein